MSIQVPPTNTKTSIYNPEFYVNPTSTSGIDVAFLNANYLQFPTSQGTEEFVDGLYSTGVINFNSSTGIEREITGLSEITFKDINNVAGYTSSIEENSTAIGSYTGGLVITDTNTINLVATNVLVNGAPIGGSTSGVALLAGGSPTIPQTFTGYNIFSNDLTVSSLNGGNISLEGNIILGSYLPNLTTGTENVAIGNDSLTNATTAFQNTSMGYQSLFNDTTGSYNSGFGYNSLFNDTTGSYNSGFGYNSLYTNTIGPYNTAIGYQSLLYNNSSYGGNTGCGTYSGANDLLGNYNTYLGYSSGQLSTDINTYTHSTAIGANAVITDSNQILLGTSSTYVSIPNYIQFSDGSQLSSSSGVALLAGGTSVSYQTFTGENQFNKNVFFKDVNSVAKYSTYIVEDSTAIGIYKGGLTINSNNTLNLVGQNVLLNNFPLLNPYEYSVLSINEASVNYWAFEVDNQKTTPSTLFGTILATNVDSLLNQVYNGDIKLIPKQVAFTISFPIVEDNTVNSIFDGVNNNAETMPVSIPGLYSTGQNVFNANGGVYVYSGASSMLGTGYYDNGINGNDPVITNPLFPAITGIASLTTTTYWSGTYYIVSTSYNFVSNNMSLTTSISNGFSDSNTSSPPIYTLNQNVNVFYDGDTLTTPIYLQLTWYPI